MERAHTGYNNNDTVVWVFRLFLKNGRYKVFNKNCVFFQFTAIHPLHVEEQLICARDLSVPIG